MLRSYIEQPLIDKEEIEKRLDAVEELNRQCHFQRRNPGIFKSRL